MVGKGRMVGMEFERVFRDEVYLKIWGDGMGMGRGMGRMLEKDGMGIG